MARVRGKRATSKQYVKIQDLFHCQPTELEVGLICNWGLAPPEGTPKEWRSMRCFDMRSAIRGFETINFVGRDGRTGEPKEPVDCH
jgi:hypothetical protein